MIFLEFIAKYIIEEIFLNIIGGIFYGLKNLILKLRGIETKSVTENKLKKLRKRYEQKSVILAIADKGLDKGSKGKVKELLDSKNALVEFENKDEIITVHIGKLLLKKK